MKIEDFGLLQRGIEQIEDGDAYSSQFIPQSQTRQPEGGKCPACHYQCLQDQQCFWARDDQVEQRQQEKHRLEMDSEARDAIEAKTVRVADNIANGLLEELPVCQAPDSLVVCTQVFSGSEVCILAPKMQPFSLFCFTA